MFRERMDQNSEGSVSAAALDPRKAYLSLFGPKVGLSGPGKHHQSLTVFDPDPPLHAGSCTLSSTQSNVTAGR